MNAPRNVLLRDRMRSIRLIKRLMHPETASLEMIMARPTSKTRMVDGFVEGFRNGNLSGWAYFPSDPSTRPGVEVTLEDRILAVARADEFRGDLLQAGKGDGRYGFSISSARLGLSSNQEFTLDVYVTGPSRHLLGQVVYRPTEFDSEVLSRFASIAEAALQNSGVLESETNADWTPANQPLYERLFDSVPVPSADVFRETNLSGAQRLCGYLDFTRYRFKTDRVFRTSESEDDFCGFLRWYLDQYTRIRGLRLPFSANDLSYLNALVHIPGTNNSLSKITWAYLLDDPELSKSINLRSDAYFFNVCYWWVFEKCLSLKVEDCLVPRAYEDRLMRIRDEWRTNEYPLAAWMETHFHRSTFLHFMDMRSPSHRRLYYLYLILASISGFKFVRYMPGRWVDELFELDGHELNRLVLLLSSSTRLTVPFRSRLEYSRMLLNDGFDLASRSYRYWTPGGHRVQSAALPRPPVVQPSTEVQLIGPLDKASGLGQATRLSSDVLHLTTLKHSSYNFSLDNPAPLQSYRDSELNSLKRAKINLIHLNAESIPLAFAYMPDVFSESYNIGYFFWELDTPANAHFLALHLLDEIWVSTEFGRSIYAPFTSKPVQNVGMAYEDSISVNREDARHYVDSNYAIPQSCFRFFVAFDSFSFVQRKNPLGVLAAFRAAFPDDPNVRLIIKTHNKDFVTDPIQERIWREVIAISEMDTRIVLINRTLPYSELILLKAGCDCYISLHRSEGWGFGLIEAMGLGIPVVATSYSGNMEFCSEESSWLVESDITYVHEDDYIFVTPGQKWAEPRLSHAVDVLRQVRMNSELRGAKAKNAQEYVRTHFSKASIARRYAERLNSILAIRK